MLGTFAKSFYDDRDSGFEGQVGVFRRGGGLFNCSHPVIGALASGGSSIQQQRSKL